MALARVEDRVSNRRKARRRAAKGALDGQIGDLPAALALGPCVEVWADPTHSCPEWSAKRRFAAAASAWLDRAGVERDTDRWRLVPSRGVWSAHRRGVVLDQCDSLRREAEALLKCS